MGGGGRGGLNKSIASHYFSTQFPGGVTGGELEQMSKHEGSQLVLIQVC